MDDPNDLTWRRKAIRLFLRGLKPRIILQKLAKSRAWFYKWKKRLARGSWSGRKDRSKPPHHSPQGQSRKARSVVIRLRRALVRRRVGLVGAPALPPELRQPRWLHPVPALATSQRGWPTEGLTPATPSVPKTIYYPAPGFPENWVRPVMDWTARQLPGGEKVFVCHTVDAETGALQQTIGADKKAARWHPQALETWPTLGWPPAWPLDPDTVATGGEKTPRRFSCFVRLGWYLGMEPIFTPPAEPKRNGRVETRKGLGVKSFWNRQRFPSLTQVWRESYPFTDWQRNPYYPPARDGLTPAQAPRPVKRQRLTQRPMRELPEALPITAGRLPFIRRVSAQGTLSFRGETGKVGQRWADPQVGATVVTHGRRLEIYHPHSQHSAARLIEAFHYEIPEPVRRRRPEFRR